MLADHVVELDALVVKILIKHIASLAPHIIQLINVNNLLICDSSDLMYLITCSRCNIQYIGETGTTLRRRFNAHRSCVSLNKETRIGIHFNSIIHNIRDLKVTPIESFSNNDKSKRLTREVYWQLILETIFPQGLNNFPVHEKDIFSKLVIKSPTDLIMFCNSLSLDK